MQRLTALDFHTYMDASLIKHINTSVVCYKNIFSSVPHPSDLPSLKWWTIAIEKVQSTDLKLFTDIVKKLVGNI